MRNYQIKKNKSEHCRNGLPSTRTRNKCNIMGLNWKAGCGSCAQHRRPRGQCPRRQQIHAPVFILSESVGKSTQRISSQLDFSTCWPNRDQTYSPGDASLRRRNHRKRQWQPSYQLKENSLKWRMTKNAWYNKIISNPHPHPTNKSLIWGGALAPPPITWGRSSPLAPTPHL